MSEVVVQQKSQYLLNSTSYRLETGQEVNLGVLVEYKDDFAN